MKNLYFTLSLLFVFGTSQTSSACSCAYIESTCAYVNGEYFDDDHSLLWVGDLVDSVFIDINNVAFQFRVVEVLRGEIVKPGSSFATNDMIYSQFENSDSLVWVIGAPAGGPADATCRYYFDNNRYLMATDYKQEQGGPFDFGPFGYTTDACVASALPLQPDGKYRGYIVNSSNETMEADAFDIKEIKDIFETGFCQVLFTEEPNLSSLQLYPNPTRDQLHLHLDNIVATEMTATIYTITGQALQSENLTTANRVLGVDGLETGIYLLRIVSGSTQMAQRFYKE